MGRTWRSSAAEPQTVRRSVALFGETERIRIWIRMRIENARSGSRERARARALRPDLKDVRDGVRAVCGLARRSATKRLMAPGAKEAPAPRGSGGADGLSREGRGASAREASVSDER